MFKEGRRGFSSLGLVLAAILMSSCGARTATESPVQEEVSVKEKESDKTLAFLTERRDEIKKQLLHVAESPEFSSLLKTRLEASLERSEDRKKDRSLPMDLRYDDVMLDFYSELQFKPVLLDGSELNEGAKILFEELQGLARHLLDESSYPLDRLLESVANLEGSNPQNIGKLALSDEELKEAAKIVQKHGIALNDEVKAEQVVALILGEDGIESLKKRVQAREQSLAANAKQAVDMELLLMDAWLKFARDLSISNMNALTDEEQEFMGSKPTDAKRREILYKRLHAHIAQLGQALNEGADATEQIVRSIYPPHTQYLKLLKAYEQYQNIVDAGGWKSIKRANIRFGRNSLAAQALKQRLAAEGYYHGEIDDNADDELRNAVLLYKRTHQMEENDELPVAFWNSLNISAKDRLAQIGENIKRWRATYLLASQYYIYINIPDFHAELWREGERQMRFPIVVGNAKRECSPVTKRMVYVNATPLQRARMLYIEYNPYWNVPRRIEQEEYIPKMHADPDWLQKNGFEYYSENNYTILRQLPGDSNALGRVKFIFPNAESTFMHDSPLKGLFRYPTRAFSHGCMRVWEPMKLARTILENDGQWYDAIEQEIEDLKPRRIVLKNRFDVFSDYYTVTVDEADYVNFLADPYRYVRDAIDPPRKIKDCTPVEKTRLARPNPDGSLPPPEGETDDVGTEMIPID
ncbi:MAG: L,D-transpeptidase family protein [Bradymonadia bacterium]|jgi:murein L,D-transpeptidase YcbB/YkuD